MRNTNRISILMAIGNFQPIVGGAERQAQRLSCALSQLGTTVSVLTQAHPGLPECERIDGAEVYRLGRASGYWAIKLNRYIQWLAFLFQHRAQVDIVHAHQPHSSAFVVGGLGKILDKPVVVKIPSPGSIRLFRRSKTGKLLFKLLTCITDVFIAPNSEIAEQLVDLGVSSHQIQKIPNCINTRAIVPASFKEKAAERGKIGIRDTDVVLVFLGRLVPVKNLGYLIPIFRAMKADIECVPIKAKPRPRLPS